MVLNLFFGSGFHLEALEGVLCLGNDNVVLRHGTSPFHRFGSEAVDLSRAAASGETTSSWAVFCRRASCRSLGEPRRNSIVDRMAKNIVRKF